MPKKIRVRCPICSQLTDQDRMIEVQDKPPELQLFLQKFGGKAKSPEYDASKPYVHYHRGGNPGRIEYEDITGSADLAPIKEWFVKRCKAFMGIS